MNVEEKLLLNACKCFFDKTALSVPDNIDWKRFCTLAQNHNLIGVCHCVFNKNKASVPEDVRAAFLNKFYNLVYLYERQTAAANDIRRCLSDAGIRHIFFKGAVLRELYPVPESRAMSDIDLIVAESDKNAAKKALESVGFNCYAPNGTVREFERGGVKAEVHTRLLTEFGETAFDNVFDYAEFDGFEGRLDNSFHLAYLIAHIAHHFKFYGAGAKLILDLAFVQSRYKIDREAVFCILKSAGLEKFGKIIFTVTYRWFDVGEEYPFDTAAVEEYLMKNGAFGSLADNKSAVVVRRGIENGGDFSPFKAKLRLAFPSYSQMRNIPYIKFIDGRPWLTPWAWCYRFVYNIKNRREFTESTVKNIDKRAGDAARAELAFFEEIGL